MAPATALTALLAAFFGSLHCVGMCGGLVLAASGDSRGFERGLRTLAYNGGRVVGYAALGAAVGLAGRELETLGLAVGLRAAAAWVSLALVAAFSLHLAGWLPLPSAEARISRGLARVLGRPGRGLPFALLGLFTALLPCGLLYMGLALALGTGTAWGGAVVMTAFGLGTVPALAGASLFASPLARLRARPGGRYVLALMVAVLGAFGVAAHSVPGVLPGWVHDLPGMERALSAMPAGEAPPACHHTE